MSTNNNKIILEGCIAQYQEENQLHSVDSEIFELFTISQITKHTNITYENIYNSIVDGGNDGGIDSILIIVNDEVIESIEELEEVNFSNSAKTRLYITQCKKENSFKELTIDKLISSCSMIFDLEKNEKHLEDRFNPDLLEKILILRAVWLKTSVKGGSLLIELNYCCIAPKIEISGTFTSKQTQLENLIKSKCSTPEVKFICNSSEELLKFYQSRKSSRFSLTFKDTPLSTTFGEAGIGYVGTVKLGDYKKFLTDDDDSIKDHVFESNIRHFQGSVDVNKKIAKTITSNSQNDFWWLNNGITIIAENPNQAGKVLSVDNVQIVNGLQSSYTIFNSHDGSTEDERSVLVKVIINKDKETIDKIIESTNSQNAVSSTALRATENTQRNIELFFLNEGYFYDRRKNYYKNQGKPASKIFSIQFTAQAIETIGFDGPHSARSKPTSLIKDDKAYNRIFDASNEFKSYLNCCLILKKTNEFWSLIEAGNKKKATTNLKLHLARIATSIILNKTEFDLQAIANIDLNTYTFESFEKSLNLLISCIRTYKEANPNVNLINMAKSKPFTEHIKTSLITI
jgi:AIPR protein